MRFTCASRANILARCTCDSKMLLSVAQLSKACRAIEYLSSLPVPDHTHRSSTSTSPGENSGESRLSSLRLGGESS